MDDYTDKFILSVLHNISDFYLIYFAFHKRVFAVGVTSKIDMAELVTITGDPNKVFFVDAYADLYSILEPLQKVMAPHHNLGIKYFGQQKSIVLPKLVWSLGNTRSQIHCLWSQLAIHKNVSELGLGKVMAYV